MRRQYLLFNVLSLIVFPTLPSPYLVIKFVVVQGLSVL